MAEMRDGMVVEVHCKDSNDLISMCNIKYTILRWHVYEFICIYVISTGTDT